ncbi:hypothetical protein BH09BAC5_BH09BAC5_12010 [soil metagenome]
MSKSPITLNNFRNELDESVLERGWYYFNNGWVKTSREVMPGYFETVVEEVNPQAVSYSLDEEGNFSDIFCTCGDKKHEICRHIAAVIFVYEKKFTEENKPTDWERIEEDSLQPFKRISKRK